MSVSNPIQGIQYAGDPFTQLENALWFALDCSPALQAIVRVGNTVRFCTDKEVPEKTETTTNDMPELALMPSMCSINEMNTSSTAGFTQRYTLAINTGELRDSGAPSKRAGLNQVKWGVIRALARYRKGIAELPFVVSVRARNAPEKIDMGPANSSEDRVPEGWTSVITIDCVLQFPWTEIQT